MPFQFHHKPAPGEDNLRDFIRTAHPEFEGVIGAARDKGVSWEVLWQILFLCPNGFAALVKLLMEAIDATKEAAGKPPKSPVTGVTPAPLKPTVPPGAPGPAKGPLPPATPGTPTPLAAHDAVYTSTEGDHLAIDQAHGILSHVHGDGAQVTDFATGKAGDTLTLPSGNMVVIAANGSMSFLSKAAVNESFPYTVKDSHGATATAKVNISVAAAPIAPKPLPATPPPPPVAPVTPPAPPASPHVQAPETKPPEPAPATPTPPPAAHVP